MTSSSPPADAAHQRRDIAESFGTDPQRYDRTRPSYPSALVDAVLAASPAQAGCARTVLDVGIGTGISARPFRDAGCTVLGVEADERMAAAARSQGFDVEVARVEQWDSAGRLFDTMIAGQSWHWVDPAAGAAQAARVLRPGGLFAAFWNAGDPEPAIAAAFGDIYRSVDTGLPFTPFAGPGSTAPLVQTGPRSAADAYGKILGATADGLRSTGAFTEPDRWRFEWETTVARDAWLDQVPTAGGSNLIPPAVLDQILAAMGEAIDAVGGSFTMRYATLAVVAHHL